MIGDFERPGRRRAAQDRALRRYLATQVRPYSDWYRETLGETGVERVDDLAKLPVTRITDALDPGRLVLRPTIATIGASGDNRLRAKVWWARVTKTMTRLNRSYLEPAYKPIHWHLAPPLPLGYTSEDLDRLAELGRSMLEMAGVGRYDVLVSVQPPEPSPAFWQLSLGARSAGVAALFLGATDGPEPLAQLRPDALAGSAADLLRLLEDGRATGYSFDGLRTLIVLGEPLEPTVRQRLSELGGTHGEPAAVVAAWAPAGVRALWSECRSGTDVHTWPSTEVLEMIDPATGDVLPPATEGEVVYTPLGWKGSVVLRLRTGVFGCLDDTPCVSCGRTSPRIRLVPFLPPFARILDDHQDVELWQAELRTVDGAEELIVFVTPRRSGHPGPLLRELDRQLSVTQFVVLDRRTLSARLRAAGEARVVDLRDD